MKETIGTIQLPKLFRDLQMNDVSDAVGVVSQRFGVFRQVNVRDGLLFATWDRFDGLLCFQVDHSHHSAIVTNCGVVSGDSE